MHGMDDSYDGSDSLDMNQRTSVLRPSSSDFERQRANSDVKPELSNVEKVKTEKRRSSVFQLVKSFSSTSLNDPSSSGTSPVKKKKDKRRTSVFDTFKSEEQLKALEIEKAKSKLRPPSYTDRILTHSLRRDKLMIDAYGFCDSIQCSDHRPVSLTMTLTVCNGISCIIIICSFIV
jgi:hypothetical protein